MLTAQCCLARYCLAICRKIRAFCAIFWSQICACAIFYAFSISLGLPMLWSPSHFPPTIWFPPLSLSLGAVVRILVGDRKFDLGQKYLVGAELGSDFFIGWEFFIQGRFLMRLNHKALFQILHKHCCCAHICNILQYMQNMQYIALAEKRRQWKTETDQ